MAPKKRTKRRWQFGLGTFLGATLLLGAGIGWWLREESLLADENVALTKLDRFYPKVERDFRHVTKLVLYAGKGQPYPLEDVGGKRIHRIARALFLDDDLAPIRALRKLERLDISCTSITGNGLRHLQNLRNLEVLDISCTSVTSDGLEHLQGLQNLRHLNLSWTKIDDDAVPHLIELTSLETLDVTHTNLSAEAISAIRSKLPRTQVMFTLKLPDGGAPLE